MVAFLATGAVVRILAPLLGDKRTDPAVVVVDEAARHAVALLGGHASGGNDLAEQVGALLDARPVVTTATDAVGLPGLDTLGWPVQGAVAAVSRAILDGEPVRLIADAAWPLPALPPNVQPQPATAESGEGGTADAADGGYRLLVTDRVVPLDERTAVLRPRHWSPGSAPAGAYRPPRWRSCCTGCWPRPASARPACAAWPAPTSRPTRRASGAPPTRSAYPW